MIISFKRFGGELPALNSLNMPVGGAQVAENMSFRHGGFRPLQAPEFLRAVAADTVAIVPQGNDFREYDRQVRFEELQGRTIVLDRRGAAAPEQLDGDIARPFGYPPTAALEEKEEEYQDENGETQTRTVRNALTTGNIAREANSVNKISYPFALTLERTVGDVVEESQLFAITDGVELSVGDEVDIEIAIPDGDDGDGENRYSSNRANLYVLSGGNWQRFRSFDLSVSLPATVSFRPNRDINALNFVREDEADFVPQDASAIAIHKQQFAVLAAGHFLYFSRVGIFSQFPEKYRVDIGEPIDDIIILENTVFVFIVGRNPTICRVNNPAAPAIYEADSNFTYRGGAKRAQGIVIYSTRAGYVGLGAGGRGQLITQGRIDENTHKQPSVAVALEDEYYAFGNDGGLWLDFRGVNGGGLEIGRLRFAATITDAYAKNDSIFFIGGGSAYRFSHPSTDTYTRAVAKWRSRKVRIPWPGNFGVVLIERDKTQEIRSAGIGGMVAQPTGRGRRPFLARTMRENHAAVRLFFDDEEVHDIEIRTDMNDARLEIVGESVNLKANRVVRYIELEVEGCDTVTRVDIAADRKQLDLV